MSRTNSRRPKKVAVHYDPGPVPVLPEGFVGKPPTVDPDGRMHFTLEVHDMTNRQSSKTLPASEENAHG